MELFKPKLKSGYIPDELDTRDVWRDEFFAGATELPEEYEVSDLKFRFQQSWPFCVAMACTRATEKKYKEIGIDTDLSEAKTFFEAGGTEQGSSIRAVLDVLVKKGAVNYEKMPIPPYLQNILDALRRTALDVPFGDSKKIKGYARIVPNETQIKQAILEDGGVIVPVAAYGAYFAGGSKRTRKDDNHVVLIKGWNKTQWILHDSLFSLSNGRNTVDISYQFQSAYSLVDLPQDWREIRDTVRSEGNKDVLNHYGQRRSLEREIEVANELLKQLKAFNNQSVLDAAGRFWPVLTNAIAYGGYSYRDCINFLYEFRRSGKFIFDFNQETRDQWFKRVKGL